MTIRDSITHEMPQTWQPSSTITCVQSAYDWLVKHLRRFDTLFYTRRESKASFGFQPFIYNSNKTLKPTWLRGFVECGDNITKNNKRFIDARQVTHEFIFYTVAELGCFIIYLNGNKPESFSYVAESIVAEANRPNHYVDFLTNLLTTNNVSEAKSTMTSFVMDIN